MKSTIQKSLYTLFLASYIFSASCFANENETPKENNETTSSSSQKKKDKSNPKVDKSKKKRPQTINKKIFLFSLPLAAIAATYMFSKRSDTPNNNGGGQIPPLNNNENNPSNNNGGNQTPQGSNPSSNNENNPSNKSGGGQNPQKNNRSNSSIDYNDVHVQEVKQLLETLLKSKDGIDEKDKEGKTLLYKYLEKGHEEAVKYLIKLGADVNSPLYFACMNSQKDIVNVLLESYGADAKQIYDDDSLLHIICNADLTEEQRKDAVDIIQLLVQHGAKINATGYARETALCQACRHGYYDLAKELIKQGADVKSGANKDNLLIHVSQYFYSDSGIEDSKKTIQLLLQHYDINDKNDEGETALHNACLKQNKEIVEYLINQGAKLNATDNYGNLPIHFACESSNSLEKVKLLIKKNETATEQFDLDKKNHKNETPLYIAASRAMHDAFKELMKDLAQKFPMQYIKDHNRLNGFIDHNDYNHYDYKITNIINSYS